MFPVWVGQCSDESAGVLFFTRDRISPFGLEFQNNFHPSDELFIVKNLPPQNFVVKITQRILGPQGHGIHKIEALPFYRRVID